MPVTPVDATPPPAAVETVVVTAARLPPAPGDAAFSIVQLTPEQLQAQPRLDMALGQVPGVGLFRRTSSAAENPTTQGISIRQIGPSAASRALVTLDGVPQNDPFGGWVIWTQLPPEALRNSEPFWPRLCTAATAPRSSLSEPPDASRLTAPGRDSSSRAITPVRAPEP